MGAKREGIRGGGTGAALAIRVTPGASKNEIAAILDDGTLRIRLTAPALEGRANRALVDFLANALDVPRSSIDIVAGENSRNKLVSILGIDPQTVQERLLRRMG